MKRPKAVILVSLLMCGLIGAVVWNYTEPWTMAYEINPVTLEVRSVEYVHRPMTGLSKKRVVAQRQMAIGQWLVENGYLKDQAPPYWELCKSYNPRWGFRKGNGRALQSCFDQAGVLTPMPHPSADSPNQPWKDWCSKHPARAKLVWGKYGELIESRELWRAGEMLQVALRESHQFDDDGEFESFLIQLLKEQEELLN